MVQARWVSLGKRRLVGGDPPNRQRSGEGFAWVGRAAEGAPASCNGDERESWVRVVKEKE